jgi:hypothetical protein
MFKKFIFILTIGITISCNAQKQNSFSEIEGKWLTELNSNDIGLAKTIFTFETDDNTFIAYTRKKATNDILGFWKSTLARIFSSDFKHGSLLNITDGIIEKKNDTLNLKGIFKSAMGNYYFNGQIIDDSLTAELTNKNQEYRGKLSGNKTITSLPLSDYQSIVDKAIKTTKSKIFNPRILKTKEWKKFEGKIKNKSTEVMDDIELIFSFYYFADNLPISHYSLIKTQPSNNEEKKTISPKRFVSLEEKSEKTAYLKIKSFSGSAKEMDSVFSIIKNKNFQNLIVDLRNNSGGTVEAGMEFAKNVVDTTIIGGVFLTQKWFSEHNKIPKLKEYNQFTDFSASNYDLIIQGIHEKKGLVLKVIPNKYTFQGKLFILTNNNTASTCEPIVYSLKQHNQATIIGETTAGAMLNGEFFDLQNGYSLIVPTADYYTSDGYKIDQNGVKPNIEIESKKALEYVINNLVKE